MTDLTFQKHRNGTIDKGQEAKHARREFEWELVTLCPSSSSMIWTNKSECYFRMGKSWSHPNIICLNAEFWIVSFIDLECRRISCFSSPKFARTQNWRFRFLTSNVCIVFDVSSSISSTRIDKIMHLSIICIRMIFLISIIPQVNTPWLKVEVIHATKWWWCASLSGMSQSWLPNSSRPLMKIKFIPWKLFATHCYLYSKVNHFDSFHIQGPHIFASTVSDFRRSVRVLQITDFSLLLPWRL
jgi:hypothetical protein